MEVYSKNPEKIIKQGKPEMMGVKNCKTFRKVLETLIGQNHKKGNVELEFYTRGLLGLYNKFHKKTNEK